MNLISDWSLRHKLHVHHSIAPYAPEPLSATTLFYERLIRTHPFQCQLELFAPVQSLELADTVAASFYYKVQLQLISLLAPAFLDGYVRRGEFHAISAQSALDRGCTVAVYNGKLRLVLDR